ncbi:MAG: hypothetical protein WCV41_02620 [Patescibacteria group bacterium]
MKYIAAYQLFPIDVKEAQKAHQDEFYRKPCNRVNGKSLGRFVETETGIQELIYVDHKVIPLYDEWLKRAVTDLFFHLKLNTNFKGLKGINGFWMANCVPGGIPVGESGFCHLLEIGAGYTAFISQDGTRVLAESYVACSGNTVVVIHKDDESILYVNSRRHGIPGLANKFVDIEVHEVIMYESLRTDVKWCEVGLTPPPSYTNAEKDMGEEDVYEIIGTQYEALLR